MPIYGYACKICEHTLDALQKMADDPLVECPACGEPALKRQLSAPRFRLKGKGWYETDFKKDNQRNIAGENAANDKDPSTADKKSDDKKDQKTDDKKDKKSDSKSETKAASKSSGKSTDSKASTA